MMARENETFKDFCRGVIAVILTALSFAIIYMAAHNKKEHVAWQSKVVVLTLDRFPFLAEANAPH